MARIAAYSLNLEDVRNMTELARRVSSVCVVVRATINLTTEEVNYIAFSDMFPDHGSHPTPPRVEWSLVDGELTVK